MPAPFQVRDQDQPGVDLGEWDEDGNITIPGTLSAGGLTGPGGAVAFAAMVAAFVQVASTDIVLSSRVQGDAANRFTIDTAGKLSWGDGTSAADITINRYAAGGLEISGALRFTNGQLLFRSDGSVNLYSSGAGVLKTDDALEVAAGLRVVSSGGAATAGRVVLVGGTATVNTTAVGANTIILMDNQALGGTAGFLRVSARVAGTSFTITSSSGTDTSTIGWVLVEPV